MKTKRVLLFSGGMDSFCAAWLWRPDVLLYANVGLKEQLLEMEWVRRCPLPPGSALKFDSSVRIGHRKLPNEILPMRNLFFVMLGAYYGGEVALAALDGDTTRDKDDTFAAMAQGLLRHILYPDDKCPPAARGGQFRVVLPFKHMTKTEIVAAYIEAGHPSRWLLDARSCYSGSALECGKCRSCVRKYVALCANGVPGAAAHFASDPSARVAEALAYAEERGRGRETEEIRRVAEMEAGRG